MPDTIVDSIKSLIGCDSNMDHLLLDLINAARAEGWNNRNKEIGTKYEVGVWKDRQDFEEDGYELAEGEKWDDQIWDKSHNASSAGDASQTAYRWGCDWRAIRNNPFIKD